LLAGTVRPVAQFASSALSGAAFRSAPAPAGPSMASNVIYGNRGGSVVGARLTSTGNIFANPLFKAALLGSFSTGNDFHIQSSSPARGLADAGAPVTDFDDQARDGDPDSGYDEDS
jgi:hypothetical protein